MRARININHLESLRQRKNTSVKIGTKISTVGNANSTMDPMMIKSTSYMMCCSRNYGCSTRQSRAMHFMDFFYCF